MAGARVTPPPAATQGQEGLLTTDLDRSANLYPERMRRRIELRA